MALQRTILIVLSVGRSSHQKAVISLNFTGFEFQPFFFSRADFHCLSCPSSDGEALEHSTRPMTVLGHRVIRSLCKLFQDNILLAESFTARGIFIAQITLGTLSYTLASFSTF